MQQLTAEEIVKYWYHYVIEYNFDLEDNILHTQASEYSIVPNSPNPIK